MLLISCPEQSAENLRGVSRTRAPAPDSESTESSCRPASDEVHRRWNFGGHTLNRGAHRAAVSPVAVVETNRSRDDHVPPRRGYPPLRLRSLRSRVLRSQESQSVDLYSAESEGVTFELRSAGIQDPLAAASDELDRGKGSTSRAVPTKTEGVACHPCDSYRHFRIQKAGE